MDYKSSSAIGEFVTGGHYNGFDIRKEEESPEITLGQFFKRESSDIRENIEIT